MVSSALNYANRLKKNKNKGPLGQIELFDTSLQVSKKTKKLFEMLKDSTNAIVHTGAGVSTGSGIPDFRGPTGIWTLMDNRGYTTSRDLNDSQNENEGDKKPKRRKMTDANCIPTRDCSNTNVSNKDVSVKRERDSDTETNDITTDNSTNVTKDNRDNNTYSPNRINVDNKEDKDVQNTEEKIVKEELNGDKVGDEVSDKEEYVLYGNNRKKAVEFILALPSETHLCLLELLNRGIVKFIITQNIDGLHSLSGIPFDKLSELHGNVFVQRCLSCARRFQRSFVAPTISFQSTGDICGICSFPPFNLLTDVVLDWFDCYEEHFEENSMKKAELADFHLVLGSSLHIEPACHYASNEYYRNIDSPLVIVNYQSTKLDPESDLIIHEDVNKICNILLKKFNLTIPTFIRKSHLVIIKYQLRNNNCILLMKLSCIINVELINKFSSSKNSSNDNYNVDKYVKLECINKLQGIYKFTFTRNFKLRLTLFYNTQLEMEVPYERVVLFKGEIWELDISASNGSKVKLSPKTFNNKCCNFQKDLDTNTSGDLDFHSNVNTNTDTDGPSKNTSGTTNSSAVDSKDGSNIDDVSTTRDNTNGSNNMSYNTNTDTTSPSKDNTSGMTSVVNESVNVDGLIRINRMTISYNSHLVQNTPYRLVGYLDLLNKKSEHYQEFKLPNSLIILSYLWASKLIQNIELHHHDSHAVEKYLKKSKMFNSMIFGFSFFKEDATHQFLEDAESSKRKKHKSKDNEKDKEDKNLKYEDPLEGYYDQYLSKTYTTNRSGSGSTKDEDKSVKNSNSTSYTKNEDNSYSTDSSSSSSSSELNRDNMISSNSNNMNNNSNTSNSTESPSKDATSGMSIDDLSIDTGSSSKVDNRDKEYNIKRDRDNNTYSPNRINVDNKENYKEMRDRSSSFETESDSRKDSGRSERTNKTNNSTTKRKDEIWNEISECNKFAELIINKSLKFNLIKIKYNKVIPILKKLNLEKYLMTLHSSLPLKLFISKNAKLGYLVENVPNELLESNKVGNYKNYNRIFRYYDLPNILQSIEEIHNDKDNNLADILDNKEVFKNLGANLYELLVYNVIQRSYDINLVGNFLVIKLFYKQLPLWILKYLSDLFECR